MSRSKLQRDFQWLLALSDGSTLRRTSALSSLTMAQPMFSYISVPGINGLNDGQKLSYESARARSLEKKTELMTAERLELTFVST